MTAAAKDAAHPDQSSGRPQITITKDTTLRIGFGALVVTIIWVAGGSFWFSELRNSDRERVTGIESSLNRQLSEAIANWNFTARTFDGYKARADRLEESLHEIKLLRHRVDQIEQAHASQERRLQGTETRLEEAQRKGAEHAIVIDYILRWINPTPTEPFKKRNEISPFRYGDGTREADNTMRQ